MDIDASEFPQDCQGGKNSFYVSYNYSVTLYEQSSVVFSVEACMPGDQSQPKWRGTRSRQHFEEVLYLKIYTMYSRKSLWRVRVDTTAGFFELPNYAHSDPGPLLHDGPREHCGQDCEKQVFYKRQNMLNTSTMSRLESTPNKGPLLTTAMALFGEGSFIANRFYNWHAYVDVPSTGQTAMSIWHCQEMIPFKGLMADVYNEESFCADNYSPSQDYVYQQIIDYLQIFQSYPETVTNAFTAAAYLANEAWLLHPSGECSLTVSLDHGTESRKPHICQAGVITISVLLSAFLLSLFAMAWYSSHSLRWASQLNSFAMIRIGASIADRISMGLVNDVNKLKLLDVIPGVMGSEADDNNAAENLKLGALNRLAGDVRYNSIDYQLTQEERLHSARVYYVDKEGVLHPKARQPEP